MIVCDNVKNGCMYDYIYSQQFFFHFLIHCETDLKINLEKGPKVGSGKRMLVPGLHNAIARVNRETLNGEH